MWQGTTAPHPFRPSIYLQGALLARGGRGSVHLRLPCSSTSEAAQLALPRLPSTSHAARRRVPPTHSTHTNPTQISPCSTPYPHVLMVVPEVACGPLLQLLPQRCPLLFVVLSALPQLLLQRCPTPCIFHSPASPRGLVHLPVAFPPALPPAVCCSFPLPTFFLDTLAGALPL